MLQTVQKTYVNVSPSADGNTICIIKTLYYIHFEITGYLCNVIGSLNRIFPSPKKNGTVKQTKQSDFKVSLT